MYFPNEKQKINYYSLYIRIQNKMKANSIEARNFVHFFTSCTSMYLNDGVD